ncbi:fatty acid synthase [Plutella xylostella]|uniref:fatty acid synthase n=1 Tax=Plutella xylostella TaxID=51655 RepID=UPI0020323BC3|nr:fatty acid synthase [Plutella xylostella]
MAPLPQDPGYAGKSTSPAIRPDAVVISGMSGLYPESRNVQALSEILYNKVNPVNSDNPRWKYYYPEMPEHYGKAPELNTFDAQFFKVYYRLGKNMEPMSRKLLEQTFQALYDAGVSPGELSEKKVGVYVGSGLSETDKAVFYSGHIKGFGLVGCCKTMFANRISYWLNLKSPSMNVDSDCASSMIALERAYESIKTGQCEAAIVGGSNICLHAQTTINVGRVLELCMDGKTKSFDRCADGCARSDAITIFFLQKAKDAKRVYAEVCHVKSEYNSAMLINLGQARGPVRDPAKLTSFMKNFYDEVGIQPGAVEYVEAFGCANYESETSELVAFGNVFCKQRVKPLLVGSVMSNIGNTEAASGTTALTKVLLGYQTGKLAANLHCENPRDDVDALRSGKMRIVTDHQRFNRSYVAINNMSLFGVNAHALLKGHFKPKDLARYKSNIPHLVLVSGRQESAVQKIFDDLKLHPVDPEEIGLLHNIHEHSISGHLGRGFTILENNKENKTVSLVEKIDYCDDAKRPLWFVYSGMGSQWASMGSQLMRISVFAAAIERCRLALEPKGIDIIHIITTPENNIYDDILHSFVGIAAVQIGLTDVLREVGLVPDNIIGHSVGELGCAYADGCMTAEETILAAYSRGLVSKQTKLIHGAMAAVGLGYKQVVDLCPPEIQVACHNSSESCTISGPSDAMREFVAKLTAQGIFAREVPCSNIAYHSRYIQDAGPALLKYLKEVIKSPKARSERWLSTSIPKERWDEPLAKFSSAEYHTNNLLNPVLFEETAESVPSNAILIEIAPHGLLQAILKRSLPSTCINIPLTRRGHADNVILLLEAIGKLYMAGCNPKIQALYPAIEYPVSTETRGLSHMIEWAHLEKWSLPLERDSNRRISGAATYGFSLHDDEFNFLNGNIHEGETILPYSAALVCVWDTLSMSLGAPLRQLSVQFSNVKLNTQPRLYDDKITNLHVQITKGNGRFEVLDDDNSTVISGEIIAIPSTSTPLFRVENEGTKTCLTQQDIYKIFHDKGSYYKGEFRSILSINEEMTRATIPWRGNWITLLDSLIQFRSLRNDYNGITQPRFIQRVTINMQEHSRSKKHIELPLEADYFINLDTTRCAGVAISNVKFREYLPVLSKQIALKSSKSQIIQNMGDNDKINVTLRSTEYGDINTIHWEQGLEVTPNDIEVKVKYAGLNIRDARKALGVNVPQLLQKSDLGYGMDFSGVTNNGERVMGIVRGGAASTRLAADPSLLWPVPEHWSLEDAATVPLPYAHAFYCLAIKCELVPRMKILVNGATGALGLAIISIALAYDCTIFASVSDAKKKHFLRRIYPSIPEDHIGNSRDSSFSDMVMAKTHGMGCDIVVISGVLGDLKNESIRCAGSCGFILDTSQISSTDNFDFGMNFLTDERNYCSVDFSSVFTMANKKDIKSLQMMVSEGIAKGYVRPLSRVIYEATEAARAFHLLASSRHRGRVLLRLHGNRLAVTPKLTASSIGSHLVLSASADDTLAGGIIDGLIARGAQKIWLHRQQQTNINSDGYMRYKLKKWQKLGVLVNVSNENNIDNGNIQALLRKCNEMGYLEGVYYITASNESEKEARLVIDQLDSVTRKLFQSVKCFAVINEIVSVGEEICSKRIDDGFPATMLTLPKLNKFADLGADIKSDGNVGISISEAVELLELAVRSKNPALVAQVQLTSKNMNAEPIRKQSGLGVYFDRVDPDELLSTFDLVLLPTLARGLTTRAEEFDKNENYLMLIPGFDGCYSKYSNICERVKIPAVAIQPGLEYVHEDVAEMGLRLAQVILKKLKPKETFYLMGYSFGVLVALEVAVVLENHGLQGIVYCVDASPDSFPRELDQSLKDIGVSEDTELQDALAQHMYKVMTGETSKLLATQLQIAKSWNDKVEAFGLAIRGRIPYSVQYARGVLEAAYSRIQHARQYDAKRLRATPLRSQLVLLRSTSHRASEPADLGLARYSQQEPTVYTLTTDHANALNDLRCANLVNRHLGVDIVEKFRNRNLCDTYILNSDVFLCPDREYDE